MFTRFMLWLFDPIIHLVKCFIVTELERFYGFIQADLKRTTEIMESQILCLAHENHNELRAVLKQQELETRNDIERLGADIGHLFASLKRSVEEKDLKMVTDATETLIQTHDAQLRLLTSMQFVLEALNQAHDKVLKERLGVNELYTMNLEAVHQVIVELKAQQKMLRDEIFEKVLTLESAIVHKDMAALEETIARWTESKQVLDDTLSKTDQINDKLLQTCQWITRQPKENFVALENRKPKAFSAENRQ